MGGTAQRFAVAATAVALLLGLTACGGKKTAAPTPSHRAYAQLFSRAVVLRTTIGVLREWPKPYQTYHDAYKRRCYEWYDKPIALYNLCFKSDGVLISKDLE